MDIDHLHGFELFEDRPLANDLRNGEVRIWSGSGFNPALNSADALVANTQTGNLTTSGTVVSELLASLVVTATGSGYTLDFEYDGFSAIALFFGANTAGWPFHTIAYDNLVIVPEISSGLLVSIVLLLAIPLIRRRGR